MNPTAINDLPIGVFDSGIGGLTVARAIREHLPGEDIVYLGDTARVPYGVKSVGTVQRYAMESVLFLVNRPVKFIVVACNTVSAVALTHLKELLRVPMVGVVEPGVRAALKATVNGRLGVIGTPSTIAAQAYQQGLKLLSPDVSAFGRACPLLVPLAEEGRLSGPVVEAVLKEYLKPLLSRGIDTLILGCTHYPLFKPAISQITGGRVRLVDSAEATAIEVKEALLREGLLRTHSLGRTTFFVTDMPKRFSQSARLFFGEAVAKPKLCFLGRN